MRHPQPHSFTTWFVIVRLALAMLWVVGPVWVHAKERDEDMPVAAILGSVQPDLFTGALTSAIPIDVPPGRQGIQPTLQLAYSSANGNGWVGMGWKLELGAVERNTRFGVNYSGNDYTFRLSGVSTELVQLPAPAPSTDYGAKIEGGFTRVRKLAAADGRPYWEATDTKGTRYLFGQTGASRMADPADANRIFKWCLDRVEDPDGNYLTVTYSTDQGQEYLSQINYTGNATTQPTNMVKFYLETRPDTQPLYTSNFKIVTAQRLKTIEVLAGGARVRAYKLNYSNASSTSRSQLSSVQQYGKDAVLDGSATVTGGTALPAMSMQYEQGITLLNQDDTFGFRSYGINCIGPPNCRPAFSFTDVNGDGRADVLYERTDVTEFRVMLSNGTAFENDTGWGSRAYGVSCIGASSGGSNCQPSFSFVDVNGDGKTDVIYERQDVTEFHVMLSTGTGFGTDTAWGARSYGIACLGPPNCRPAFGYYDMNGDGKADFVYMRSDANEWRVLLSTGTGFGVDTYWGSRAYGISCVGASPGGSNCQPTFSFADVNGDGKTDVIYERSDVTEFRVMLSTGASFSVDTAWGSRTYGIACAGAENCVPAFGFFDGNGDGQADFIYHRADTDQFRVLLSTGTGFEIDTEWGSKAYGIACASGPPCRPAFGYFDINGDGKADFVYNRANSLELRAILSNGGTFNNDSLWGTRGGGISCVGPLNCQPGFSYVDVTGDGRADFVYLRSDSNGIGVLPSQPSKFSLTSISNGLGANTTMAYAQSTKYTNTQLPFPLQTVSSITTNDGNGNLATTTYTYAGGFHHIGERDSRGFNYAKLTGPVGPSGEQAITEIWFHQGNDVEVDVNNPYVPIGYLMGKPYRTRVSNGQSQLYTETTTRYAPDADGVGPFFTPPLQVDTSICDGTDCGKQTRVVYTYDGYGNVAQEEHYGDLDNPIDDRTIVRGFVPNTTDWLVSLPAEEVIFQGIGDGPQIAATFFYYDGVTDCAGASTNQYPTRGHLTRVVRWLDAGASPETRMAYDGVGNRVCTRDPNGNTTSLTYDSSATFPTVVTNALGHQSTSQYYGVGGVAADTGLYGQVKRVTDPNGAVVVTEYDALGRMTKMTQPDGFWTTMAYQSLGTVGVQHVRKDTALGLSTWTYLDGLGRPIRQRRTGPDAKIIVTDTQYNARGAVLRTSLPYFEVGGAALWRTMTYDPLGRVTQIVLPDGSRTLRCEDDWVTVTIDANNHRKREARDAAGHVIRIDEYLGTFGACDTTLGTPYATTAYEYDLLGRLRFVLDAKGNLTEMQYDTLGRKVFMHDPDMGNWTYQYDAAGNLTRQTDAKGQQIFYQYDALHRRRQKDYGNPKPLGSGDVLYSYDQATSYGIGRLTSRSDGAGSAVLYYDVTGRRTRTDQTVDNVIYVTQHSYDGMGRVTAVGYPDNSVVSYAYNGPWLDRAGDTTTIYARYSSYNALGQPASTTFGNGVVTTATYANPGNAACAQPTFRLCTLRTVLGSQPAYQDLAYAYDTEGNVAAITDPVHGTQTFGYDALNRLTAATGPYGSYTYQYNEIGNLTNNPRLGPMSYPPSGWDSLHPHAVTQAGSYAFTYDANGNILDGAGYIAVYDLENRPTTITYNGTTTTFIYDGDGGRVKKVEGTKPSVYIGKLYVCEFVDFCAKFIWAGSQRIALKQVTSGSVTYFHTDHLGSTSVVTNEAGVVDQTLTYYPFGETQSSTGSANIAYKYTGKEQDNLTGLYFYEARYYHPVLGRFMTADTIVPNPRDPQELNRYTYAGNNPLKYTDPTGHFKIKFTKFFSRAFGDVGTTLVGIAVASFTGCYACGYAIMTQSESGRYTLAAGIVATSAIATFYCGGCGATFTIAGLSMYAIPAAATVGAIGAGTLGGMSAAQAGGDISSGVLFGTAVGAAAGALNGYLAGVVSPGQFSWSTGFFGKALEAGLLNMAGGAALNAASGSAIGYAGGRGNWDTMLQAAGRSVAAGAKTDAATTLLGLGLGATGPNEGFEIGWDVEPMGSKTDVDHVHLFDVSKSMATSLGEFFKIVGGNAPQWDELGNDRLRDQLRRSK